MTDLTDYQQWMVNAVDLVGGLIAFIVGYLTVVNA